MGIDEAVSGRFATAKPHRIKASHRRRWKRAAAHREYQHTDALGSPVATTNSAKTVLQRSEYEPYGYLLNRPMEDGPGYTGHVTDAATGLVYMQARYYDPLCGCFVSTDPVTALKGPFNRYWYANANPYKFKDPDGRQVSAPHSCNTDNTCIPLNQVKRDDASMMTKLVLPPVVAGATAGVGTATGATAATASATGRLATAADAKYTAAGIAVLKNAQSAVNTTVRVVQAVGTKAMELKDQAMTSSVAVASMKYRDELTDTFEGFVGQLFGAQSPPKSAYEIAGERAAAVLMDNTNTDPQK